MIKSLIILGASGSIGSQCLSVLQNNPGVFSLVGFSVGHKTRKISNIVKTHPEVKAVTIQDKSKLNYFSKKYPNIRFFVGDEGLLEIIRYLKPYMVVNALVGFVGLKPTIETLSLNIKCALANKESLVAGGELVNILLKEGKGELFPIDSEHSALWKCLKVQSDDVDKLIITASGGAFRKLNRDQLVNVKASDALKHPTWKMGSKITIDCATLTNKSFEVIEAFYLFNYDINHVDILLHDESMIHSMVKYNDGTYRAEISKPDMRNPIKFALFEGKCGFDTQVSDDYHKFGDYHFHDFDIKRYPIVRYAKLVMEKQGTYGTVFNAANEVAVYAFLNDEIPFLAIESLITKLMENHKNKIHPTLQDIVNVDILTREQTRKLIEKGDY